METNKKIILASGSPRRIEMLAAHGIQPVVMPAHIEENDPIKPGMCRTPMFLALKKAQATENCYLQSLSSAGTASSDASSASSDASSAASAASASSSAPAKEIIIAADTIVYKDGEIMGKPTDADEGFRMLEKLRNTYHYVVTGVALLEPGRKNSRVFAEITKVYFKDYNREELLSYLATDEAYDKAGAYAIQGYFSKHIDHIEGSLDNVIGFPWDRIKKEIKLL